MIRAIGQSGRRFILNRAAHHFVDLARSAFGGAGSRWRGNEWPKYSKEYARRVGNSSPTLLRSGRLKNSIRVGPPRGNFIEIYTNLPYSAAQFLGNRSRGLPGRRFYPVEQRGRNMFRLTYNAEREMLNEISRRLTSLSNGAFPRLFSFTRRSNFEHGNPTLPPSAPADPRS